MLSFPFNSSTTVFWYNKDAFEKAGLDPNRPPKTWPEVVAAVAKLKASGETCRYTTGWPSWTQLERFSAWHDVPFASEENGFAGNGRRSSCVNGRCRSATSRTCGLVEEGLLHLRRPQERARGQVLQRRVRDADVELRGLREHQAQRQVQVRQVDDCRTTPTSPGAPQNTIIGGATLWVMNGKKTDEYKGVAKFFTFLSSPEIQAEWHQADRLPADHDGRVRASRRSPGFYEKNPGTDVRSSR